MIYVFLFEEIEALARSTSCAARRTESKPSKVGGKTITGWHHRDGRH